MGKVEWLKTGALPLLCGSYAYVLFPVVVTAQKMLVRVLCACEHATVIFGGRTTALDLVLSSGFSVSFDCQVEFNPSQPVMLF